MNSILESNIKLVAKWRKSPTDFIADMWGLVPQIVKPEYKTVVDSLIAIGQWDGIKAEMFGVFIKGKHITWQQWVILLAVERALQGKAQKRISVKAGHGIGKSFLLSAIILWFLFCWKDAQVPCTAPTSDQMHDVLWKELSLLLGKMPEPIKNLYEWQTGYLRMKQRPESWFARAKTARKENPEALAGVHADHVLAAIDEGSGIDDVIYRTAEGIFTNPDILVIIISNPTRLMGYFYDTHHSDKRNWQTLTFSSLDSPIVDEGYNRRIADKHGVDSDEYRIRVLGEFPRADAVDEQGFVPLLMETDLRQVDDSHAFVPPLILGIDPAGDGDDKTVWVLRDAFRAKILGIENKSTPKGIAQRTVGMIEQYKLKPSDIFIDNFGVGADVVRELVIAGYAVMGVNGGDKGVDEDYLNTRAEAYWRVRNWLIAGGELIRHDDWRELLTMRYRRELSGKIKMMSKDDMRKNGYPSPNVADSLSYCFYLPVFDMAFVHQQEQENNQFDTNKLFSL